MKSRIRSTRRTHAPRTVLAAWIALITSSFALACGSAEGEGAHDERMDGESNLSTLTQELWTSCSSVSARPSAHASAGRAHACGSNICANGSNVVIGRAASTNSVILSQSNPGYYVVGGCLGPTRYDFPIDLANGRGSVIHNYMDLDPTTGLRDYTGGSKTIDGHAGIDVGIANFRVMDSGYTVRAAAPGVVMDIRNDQSDRNLSCTGLPNYVRIRHANGSVGIYLHFKRNSIVVSGGTQVAAGTVLGQVGSSGCSTWPHLHFEVQESNGGLVDPFKENLINSPPAYTVPLHLMDAAVMIGNLLGTTRIADPGPNATSTQRGQTITVVAYHSNGLPNEQVSLTVTDSAQQIISQQTRPLTGTERLSVTSWVFTIAPNAPTGTYQIAVRAGGDVSTRNLFVF